MRCFCCDLELKLDRMLRLHIERVEAASSRLDRLLLDTRSKMRVADTESY